MKNESRNRDFPKWSERTRFEKGLYITQVILTLIVLACGGLQISGIFKKALYIVYPAMAVDMLLLSIQYKKYNKTMSYIYLATAIFGVICSIRIFYAL